MSAVGSITLFDLEGDVPEPARFTRELQPRLGVDGHAFMQEGKRAPAVALLGTVQTTDAATLSATLQAMIGTLVTVVTSFGKTIDEVMVLPGTRVLNVRTLAVTVGGDPVAVKWVSIQFLLQATKVT